MSDPAPLAEFLALARAIAAENPRLGPAEVAELTARQHPAVYARLRALNRTRGEDHAS